MKKYAILSIFLCFSISIFSQKTDEKPAVNGHAFCAHDQAIHMAGQKPHWRQLHDQIERQVYEHFQGTSGKLSLLGAGGERGAAPPPYTLPVVVHIIHDNGAENIPDAVVLQGIQDLNDAYANVGYYGQGTGVNTQIQFCLAKRDPDGNATTGINRVQSTLTEMTLETDDITVKDLSRWDPLKYINIWLVREICSSGYGCGVAGYAYFPASHGGPEDGIMMEAEFFGSTPGGSGVQVHEMGHYLGLYHTFQGGCVNNDCLADGDRVCDTPPDQSTAWIPCGSSSNSCSTDANSGFASDVDDLFQDYMDYSDFDCYSMFTQGQAERMHWHIDNVRFSLLESQGCLDPCTSALTALFSSSSTNLTVGGTVNFTNNSVNTTSSGWEIDGTAFASSTDASYTFNTAGTFEICLNVGNDDPNCSDVFCESITVTCPVQAEFSTSVFYPNPGETVSYTNLSSNATDYEWTVNGTSVGTSQNLDYAFANEGIYDLCLTAGNGLCTEEFCLQVFVSESPSGGCDNATFVRIFGGVNDDEEGMCIVPSGDGNLYVGGRSGSKTLIIKSDINGDPIWMRDFQFTSKNDIVSQLYVDSDGNVVGCGYGDDGSTNFTPYVFKYDPVADAVLWSWNYSHSGRSFNIIEPTPGSDYIVTQDMRNSPSPGAFEDAILRELDRNTGAMTGNLATSYNIGSSETFSNTILHDGQLYATGRYTNGAGVTNMRMSLTRFDLDGTEVWTKLAHVPTSGNARLYGRDMLIENDSIYTSFSGDDDSGSATVTNFFLQKNDLDGNIIWTKKYEIPSMQNEWAEEIVSVNDGFLMLGYERATPTQLFLVKTDKFGDVLWAKSYGDLGNESLRFTCESQMFAAGNFIYFTAWSDGFNGTRDLILVKTDSEGNLEDDCLLGMDIDVDVVTVSNPANADFDLLDYPNPQTEMSVQTSPVVADLPFQDLEGCECIPEEGCDTTFLKTYGTLLDDEDSRAIAAVPTALGGGFLLGGGKADSAMLTLLNPAGDIIWTRSFDATFDADDYVTDLIFDSDNFVAGVGQTKNEPQNNRECFIFRYNLVSNQMLWVNELDLNDPANETYVSILEKNPGGNYVVSGQTDDFGSTGCNGILVEVNRATGANIWQRNYTLGSCETFSQIITADGSIFATGRYNFDGGGQARMRPGITRFDLSGNQQWSRLYLEPVTFSDVARLYSQDIVDDNGLVIFGNGDDDGTSTTDNILFLYRTDYDGNIEWARQYDIPGSSTERGRQLFSLPDGYLCIGFHSSPDLDAFIFKTDKQGNLLWSKNYGEAGGDEDVWDMLWQNGQIYFTGRTTTPTSGVSEDIYLASISADGTVAAQDTCNLFTDLDITQAAWQDPYDAQHNLDDLSQQWGNFLGTAVMGETAVQSTVECFIPCLDTCDLLPEVLFEAAVPECNGTGLTVSLTLCNTGNFDLPAGTPVTFYDSDPTAGAANVVATLPLPAAVEDGDCLTVDLDIPGLPNTAYFVMANDDGTTPTPFDLTTFGGSADECDFTNNLGSFEYDFNPPILDLGPDVETCDNQVVELDAGPGFASYEWNDGSNMQTLTAWWPGTYWVTVIDECGGVQNDTIVVSVDPATVLDLGPDLEICEGGSIDFDLADQFFDQFEWTPSTGVTCNNASCSEATVSPSANTTYTVVASNANGCYSVDTVSITLLPGFETSEALDICDGDTILVFGNPVFAAGEYSETFTSQDGCDSTHTVTVTVLENISTSESISICDGETVIVFGEEVSTAGEYSETFTSSNGCDSVHTVTVTVLENVFTSEGIFICFGESADIFGTPTSTAGVYEMTFPSSIDCDSTHTITLTVNEEISIGLSANDASCFGASNGSATASASGGSGGFTYLWGNGKTTPTISGLTAGTYTVEVTDSEGCTASASIEISQPTAVEAAASGVNVSCDELGSATASATGGTGDFTFEWSNSETGADISGLEAGTYSVTATDANGCTAEASVEITGALGPAVSIAIDALPSEDDPNSGALTASTTGGTAPFDFAWSNGGVGASQTGLPSGQYTVTVTDANGCTAEATAQIYIPACTGGKIWNDLNRDGCQAGGELGMAGIEMELNGTDIWGNAVTMTTTTAINGEYIFESLPPGNYQVTLPVPTGYSLSPVDACGDDFVDSDFDANGVSYIVELTEGHCCLIVDGGLYDACLNVYDPGEICCDQALCGPGNDPEPLTSVSPAQGANAIEYMWMFSHDGGGFGNGTWVGIPGTNSLSYDPGPIQQTTHYARCVRAIGCTEWLETNTVTITVDDVAVAAITPPPSICVGDPVTFAAAPNPAGATYSWYFGQWASPSTSTEQNPTVTWSQAGYPSVTLTVTYAGCTSTETVLVAVSDNPVYCGTALQNPGAGSGIASGFQLFPNPATDYLTIRWVTRFDSQVDIELLSIDGRQLLTAQAEGEAQFFRADLSELVSGVYVLQVRFGDGEMEVFRVVKE